MTGDGKTGTANLSDGCFLGVDGGGTKTAFVLTDRGGRELARYEGGSSYYIQIGVEGLHNLLQEGVHVGGEVIDKSPLAMMQGGVAGWSAQSPLSPSGHCFPMPQHD